MAYTIQTAFDQFFEAINLGGDHRETANARRDRIVALLSNHFTILEAFSTGSIPRYTALRGKADLDVMVVLHYGKHIEGKSPTQVLQSVRDALAEYRSQVRKNGQAVTL
jgi:tRNA nucleotidyltransferase (CCA-adding enzyme)